MPAKSIKQQQTMAIAGAIQQGKVAAKPGTPSAQIARTMEPPAVKKFASTPQKGLPVKVTKTGTLIKKMFAK